MPNGSLRIGIVGAGRIARERHIPGFRALPDVEIVGVCNRRRESSSRVAREFDIPKIYGNWENLVDDDEIDAVVIATWPYLHCPITLAAFDAGKHVLTQARMAMNAREAQRMLDRKMECPELVGMVVPSPYGLTADLAIQHLIANGYLGELREVHVTGLRGELADAEKRLGWRQITRYSGFNMLDLGILHETALRWTPPVSRVMAHAAKVIKVRPDAESGKKARVGTPDSVRVLTTQKDGSVGLYRHSGVVHHGPKGEIALYGSRGTLVYDLVGDILHGARADQPALSPVEIPEELRGGWRVEAEFVSAIRDGTPVTRADFIAGALYMHFTEAVARSSRHQEPVDLPLKEFSNPSL